MPWGGSGSDIPESGARESDGPTRRSTYADQVRVVAFPLKDSQYFNNLHHHDCQHCYMGRGVTQTDPGEFVPNSGHVLPDTFSAPCTCQGRVTQSGRAPSNLDIIHE